VLSKDRLSRPARFVPVGPKRPDFVIVDGAPGLEAALVALWGDDLPIQRCMVHKHRNLLAHTPKHMHDELTEDYRGMIYADTSAEVERRRKAFLRKWRLKCRAVATALRKLGRGCSPSPASMHRSENRHGPPTRSSA
jgi:transposase-like protein